MKKEAAMHLVDTESIMQGLDTVTGEIRIVVRVVHDDIFAARVGVFGQYGLADDQQVH